ncbi:zinc finger protein Xfin-like [Culicoides brevitarsis]|uniref:zinc finger protein Xfin-like n=1 Tax=Culicoides brevitarsis TaxID=469753 RepID=UPI00307CC7A6
MLEDPLDDDTHICIKCNATIVGLDQYIRHRKSNCASTSNHQTSQPKSPVKAPEYSLHDHAYDGDKDHHSPMHTFDYDLGADFFFSSLELQSSTKKVAGGKTLPTGGKSINPRDNSPTDKLFSAVTVDDAINPKPINYFDDDDDDVSPDEEQDDTDPEEYGGDIPPRNYTGGKWKPENRPSSTLFRGWERAWDDDRLEKSFDESVYDDEAPPPGHTKGKWVPGSKITKLVYDKPEAVPLSTQYWCNSCNRGLASKIVYERHLKSNLHLKKIQEEKDLETVVCPIIERPERIGKRNPKPSVYSNENLFETSTSEDKQKRIRRKYFTNCDICKTRLPIKLLGKHLISHYHYRRMQLCPEKAYETILSNIDKIVVQSPFQCAPCKFYANTQENFFRHWTTKNHEIQANSVPGNFLCNFCKFETPELLEMTSHLSDEEHQEVVKAINRSVPIIIQKFSPIVCAGGCGFKCRFNIEMNKHRMECNEEASHENQVRCEKCEKNFKTKNALVKHLTSEHKETEVKKFFCSICKENFETPELARKHRRTTEHRVKSARLRGLDKDGGMSKKCGICGANGFSDVLVLKEHIRVSHPEIKYSCPHCAASFVLPQELSRHVRDKNCNFFTSNQSSNEVVAVPNVRSGALVVASSSTATNNIDDIEAEDTTPPEQSYFTMTASMSGTSSDNGIYVDEIDGSIGNSASSVVSVAQQLWKCKLCTFGTKSRAEFIHHKILHNVPNVKPTDKLECPFCKRHYVKASLRCHLRIHTNERLYGCNQCSWSFIRAANLKEHIRKVHERPSRDEEHLFTCDFCSKDFRLKHLLSEHILSVHRVTTDCPATSTVSKKTYNCTQCSFIAKTSSGLNSHVMNQHEESLLTFECSVEGCSYQGKSQGLLKRHMEIHEAPKRVYSCTKCDFETRHSGHLKRHLKVHDTNEDRFLQCPHCDYRCNIMDNLRKHVIKTSKHIGRYLYECSDCNTGTNSTQEFKEHLSSYHGQLNVDLSDYFINKVQY